MHSQDINCFSVVAAFDLITIEDPIKMIFETTYSSFNKDSGSSFPVTQKVGIFVLDLLKF